MAKKKIRSVTGAMTNPYKRSYGPLLINWQKTPPLVGKDYYSPEKTNSKSLCKKAGWKTSHSLFERVPFQVTCQFSAGLRPWKITDPCLEGNPSIKTNSNVQHGRSSALKFNEWIPKMMGLKMSWPSVVGWLDSGKCISNFQIMASVWVSGC